MKRMVALTMMIALGLGVTAANALALDLESSWGEIRSTPDIHPEAPMIFIGVHGVSVLDACLDGDKVREATDDGSTSEISLGSRSRHYDIRVDRQVIADAEHTYYRYLFTKPFDIPACGVAGAGGSANQQG